MSVAGRQDFEAWVELARGGNLRTAAEQKFKLAIYIQHHVFTNSTRTRPLSNTPSKRIP